MAMLKLQELEDFIQKIESTKQVFREAWAAGVTHEEAVLSQVSMLGIYRPEALNRIEVLERATGLMLER